MLQRRISCRFAQALFAVGITSSLGCQVTMAELQARSPGTPTLEVSCRPSEIPDNVTVMAFQSQSRHIVTDENQSELLSFAPLASVFIRFNDAAPEKNAEIMASEYGLLCPRETSLFPPSSELFRNRERCATQVGQASGRADPHLLAEQGKPPCDSPGQTATAPAASAPTSLPRIAVCARPPGIAGNEWYGGRGIDGTVTNADDHAKEIAKATVIFYLHPSAPPESVWYFGPKTKIRCPGKAPMPYDKWVAANTGTGSQQSGSTSSSTTSAPTPAAAAPKKGDGKTTETSSADGQGPPLSTFETIARNLALAGAISQMDTSGNPKDPNGHRNGIPGGKSLAGFSFPLLQAGVSTLQILSSVGLSPKSFVDDIVKFAKRGQRTIIKEADAKMMQVADDLIKNSSQYEMAKGLEEMQTIMPFKMGQKFTAGLEGKFQAHKIFERRAFEKVLQMDGKALEEAVEKAPAIILTDTQHTEISNALNAAWKKYQKPDMTKADLRKIYDEVYRTKYPQWLDAIDSYLR